MHPTSRAPTTSDAVSMQQRDTGELTPARSRQGRWAHPPVLEYNSSYDGGALADST